ncbi:MAG: TetR/AcrR family transcriptional regulator C-terminal domain-containing protein [Egibacteraceae bacterium]
MPANDAEKALGRERLRDDYPILGSAVSDLRVLDHTATFEHGLRLMIGGLRARHAELAGTPAPAESTRSLS